MEDRPDQQGVGFLLKLTLALFKLRNYDLEKIVIVETYTNVGY